MTPDDPRHGLEAGYHAHRTDGEEPCLSCRVARNRARKSRELQVLAGHRLVYTAAEFRALLGPWLEMGLTAHSMSLAAGLEGQRASHLYRVLREDRPVLRSTYSRFAAVTEADLPGAGRVYADLTRRRIYSLMAAGHRLVDMPINPRGRWRTCPHVTITVARAVRDHYRAHEQHPGSCVGTRTRALAEGHQPPAGWDDPDTLAWPHPPTTTIPTGVDVDPVVVARILAGDRVDANPAERAATITTWTRTGRPLVELERITGWNTNRELRRQQGAA